MARTAGRAACLRAGSDVPDAPPRRWADERWRERRRTARCRAWRRGERCGLGRRKREPPAFRRGSPAAAPSGAQHAISALRVPSLSGPGTRLRTGCQARGCHTTTMGRLRRIDCDEMPGSGSDGRLDLHSRFRSPCRRRHRPLYGPRCRYRYRPRLRLRFRAGSRVDRRGSRRCAPYHHHGRAGLSHWAWAV